MLENKTYYHKGIAGDCGLFSLGSRMGLNIAFEQSLAGVEKPLIGELGCWTGSSTIFLAKLLEPLGGSICTIDWFKGSGGTNLHLRKIAAGTNVFSVFLTNVKRSKMKNISVLCMDSETAARLIKNSSFDMFFVDGDHCYECVERDIRLWLPKLKKGRIICGHDYSDPHPGVIKAVNEVFGKDNIRVEGSIWWARK